MITNKLITSSFGCESLSASAGRRGNVAPTNAMEIASGGWSLETEQLLVSLINGASTPITDGGVMDRQMRSKAIANVTSNSIASLVKKYGTESVAFSTLPKEVRSICEVPAMQLFAYKNAYSAAATEDAKFKIKFKMDQAKSALESTLWSVFSGVQQLQQHKRSVFGGAASGLEAYSKLGKALTPNGAKYRTGMEGVGMESTSIANYTDQIFIPKISAFNSWLNVAAVIMPKVQKTKTVLNEVCEIPVSTKHMVMIERDDTGNEVATHKREDLYANMDMSKVAPALDSMRTRDLTIATPEFNKHQDLHKSNLSEHGNKPFLAYNEHIGPQLQVQSFTTSAKTFTGEIHDIRAGLAQGPTLGQLDTKGKVIPYTPDAEKPEEVYNLVFDWDVQDSRIFFTYTKTVPTMDDITKIVLRANMRDLEQTLKSKIAFRIKEERTVLAAPAIDRYVLPIISDELDLLNDRGSANHLNKLVELTSEFTQNKKESQWIKDYRKMKDLLKVAQTAMATDADADAKGNSNLYVSQNINLNTLAEIRKPESIAYHLGNNLNIIKDNFATLANSHHEVQLSLFAGTLSLNVISQCFESITGDIAEDSDAKFLGVAQTDRVKAITFGNTKASPVQAIVVGTDKKDFVAKGKNESGVDIETSAIEYKFEIIPTYKDENIQTTLFIEQPTKVISGTEIRANEYPLLPAMIIHEGYKFNVLRPAAGDITITGVGFRAVR